jgi:hypothetical protein
MASQPLDEVSKCQEFDLAAEPSRRRIDGSVLTTSKLSVSIVFGAMSEETF